MTTASRRGTANPVTRTRSEKQALVDFVTITSALFAVSFSSEWERCSNQYQTAPRTMKTTVASTGLRNRDRFIAGLGVLSRRSVYFEAVVLFSMLTTCTRRFTSANGL